MTQSSPWLDIIIDDQRDEDLFQLNNFPDHPEKNVIPRWWVTFTLDDIVHWWVPYRLDDIVQSSSIDGFKK